MCLCIGRYTRICTVVRGRYWRICGGGLLRCTTGLFGANLFHFSQMEPVEQEYNPEPQKALNHNHRRESIHRYTMPYSCIFEQAARA